DDVPDKTAAFYVLVVLTRQVVDTRFVKSSLNVFGDFILFVCTNGNTRLYGCGFILFRRHSQRDIVDDYVWVARWVNAARCHDVGSTAPHLANFLVLVIHGRIAVYVPIHISGFAGARV